MDEGQAREENSVTTEYPPIQQPQFSRPLEAYTRANSNCGPNMSRSLIDLTYSEGNIASGKCTGCGQLFTASPAALSLHENPEWGLVGAFGGHECTPSRLKPVV
jgi:hypothetical protein